MWIQASEWARMVGGRRMYRGFTKKATGDMLNIHSPQNRVPRDMPSEIQAQMDFWFEQNLGFRYRQGAIFVTGDLDIARQYAGDHGEVRTLQPTGPFHFCWGRQSNDLYGEYVDMRANESVTELLQRLEFQCGDLAGALDSGNEIMLVGAAFQAAVLKKASNTG